MQARHCRRDNAVAGLSVQGVGFAGFVDDERVGAAHLDTDAAGTEHELDNPAFAQNLQRSGERVAFGHELAAFDEAFGAAVVDGGMDVVPQSGLQLTTTGIDRLRRAKDPIEDVEGLCHIAVPRARSVGGSGIIRPLLLPSATCPSPRREACGAFELR